MEYPDGISNRRHRSSPLSEPMAPGSRDSLGTWRTGWEPSWKCDICTSANRSPASCGSCSTNRGVFIAGICRRGRKGAFSRFLSAVSPGTDALKWTYLARERKRMADSAHETAVSGETVIEERFPLSQFWSMDLPMDGPRLQNKRQGRRPMLSRVELRTYESVKQPDLFLVLDADLETLHARKTDLTIEEHQAKVEAVKALKPSEQLRIIDVELPYEDVLLEAKRVLWELIDARA